MLRVSFCLNEKNVQSLLWFSKKPVRAIVTSYKHLTLTYFFYLKDLFSVFQTENWTPFHLKIISCNNSTLVKRFVWWFWHCFKLFVCFSLNKLYIKGSLVKDIPLERVKSYIGLWLKRLELFVFYFWEIKIKVDDEEEKEIKLN